MMCNQCLSLPKQVSPFGHRESMGDDIAALFDKHELVGCYRQSEKLSSFVSTLDIKRQEFKNQGYAKVSRQEGDFRNS